jgi:predicted ATPase
VASSKSQGVNNNLPFIGREVERKKLREAAASRQLALIEGEPGIGKTRLAEEFLRGQPGLHLRSAAHELEHARPINPSSMRCAACSPHRDNAYEVPGWPTGPINCLTRFMLGLSHDNAHLAQIQDVVQQSRATRS